MPDPAPIRGRWTILLDLNGRKVEVVPVPDEAAIERAAKALIEALGYRQLFDAKAKAEAVLRAALEPPSGLGRTMDRP